MSSAIHIRECTRADCTEVLQLWKSADATPSITDTLDEVDRTVAQGDAIFLVATDRATVSSVR
jgi:hypothetical protein